MPESRSPASKNTRPLLILGLDSGDYRLCEHWAGTGDMPHFRKIMRRAHRLTVQNPPGFEAGSLWPCFNLGADVDEHGQFDGYNIFDPEIYARRRLDPKEYTGTYFWQNLSDAGHRVLVVDPPYVPLLEDINGLQVVDWMTHVRTGDSWLRTSPPELAETMAKDFGLNPFSGSKISCPTDEFRPDTAKAILDMRDALKRRIRAKQIS